MSDIIAIVALIIALSAIVICFMLKNSFTSKINDLTKLLDDKILEINILKGEIKSLTNRVKISEEPPTIKVESSIKTIQPPIAIQISTVDHETFFKEFNSLLENKAGIESRVARDEFLTKYNVKGFNCTNFNDLINNPKLTPTFADVTTVQVSEYWAYEFELGKYAVVPNIKTYTENHHTARAMGQVFKSNFTFGGTYDKVQVVKPAIFEFINNTWKLNEQGEISLK